MWLFVWILVKFDDFFEIYAYATAEEWWGCELCEFRLVHFKGGVLKMFGGKGIEILRYLEALKII